MPYAKQKTLTQVFGYTTTAESDRVTCASESGATLLLFDGDVVWPIRLTSATPEGAVVTLEVFVTPNDWSLSEAEVATGISSVLTAFQTCGQTLEVAHFVPPSP
jgi:hypothetical protein